ncbi:MAG: ATP-binding protein [Microcystis aeruginosa K13-05]|uniref:ATP-binding protein n=1 Tax=unclassified Microcystis TaxID=2643300 RepID=UPI0022CB2A75|nr:MULTISPECIES: ATP-binding protein [unclassified Microcystis]MCZ8045504.1 ATP-binding protein [Microcystis sp. LE19-41.2A]MCZ8289101.1 ATP-binding protein [Microcystis sp. LE19-59.1C]NCR80966.1 ATP-binding protein [Microcystis aeruginosa K13-10]NCR85576.1 ATP-binding protein [Microcystis aeruginosa K13-05]
MKLDQFEYISNRGNPNEWRIDGCQLGNINLIVGKNASGKSRIVRVIYLLSELLCDGGKLGNRPTRKDEWHLLFDKDSEHQTEYFITIENGYITQEKLKIGEKIFLQRDKTGEGRIYAKELDKDIRFQTPTTELAVVKRRDTIQHPFLEDIYKWSSSLRFYEFGTQLGKNTIATLPPTTELLKAKTDAKDCDHVVGIFVLGKREHSEFTQRIIDDMNRIGYQIAKIETKVPSFFKSNISPPENLDEDSDNLPKFLYVQEDGLKSVTEQSEISQVMFRALSLFIQINYAILSDQPSCIIIDDIGEGLDFQRSSAIIKLLIEKAKTGLVQLIMTTNDENIMNGVPLEYWSVIERQPGVAKLHNYSNSPEQFEQFKHIGLNNFDFFASEYYLQEPNSEEVID